MKYVKAGMHTQVLVDTDTKKAPPNDLVSKYHHLRVLQVMTQDQIKVTTDDGTTWFMADRLTGTPAFRTNRFGAGS